MKVYLCGPINGCTDNEANNWRDEMRARIGVVEWLDPMRRDYRGREAECVEEIVKGDIQDVDDCDVVLANCWNPSFGTAMEVFYAHQIGKLVIVVTPKPEKVSPWLRYHSRYVVGTLVEAEACIHKLITERLVMERLELGS